MINKETLYTLNDIVIVPAQVSGVEHRSECKSYRKSGYAPLFVSPMTNLINDENWNTFDDNYVRTILPRDNEQLPWEERKERWEKYWHYTFVALSLNEFIEYFIERSPALTDTTYVCIDIANGHMAKLLRVCKEAKEKYEGTLVLMTGNIANPDTYYDYAKAGIDYVRCGIGTGSICTTAANSAVHYPMASLIEKCKCHKNEVEIDLEHAVYKKIPSSFKSAPKIVADGGFTNFDQIIKALALGADYVMCGKLFAQCVEACAPITLTYASNKTLKMFPDRIINEPWKGDGLAVAKDAISLREPLRRQYYGMSTKLAQKEMGGKGTKTAEGIVTTIDVKYTVAGWMDNFLSYLKSAMSYSNCYDIETFSDCATCQLMSNNSYLAYFK